MVREIIHIPWEKGKIPNWKYPTINTYFQVENFKRTKINITTNQKVKDKVYKNAKLNFFTKENYSYITIFQILLVPNMNTSLFMIKKHNAAKPEIKFVHYFLFETY